MKFAIGLLLLLTCGCALVPTDGWPKLAWYWSADAKEQRMVNHAEKLYFEMQTTNIVNP